MQAACAQLVAAYKAGQANGGNINWSDIDDAHGLAKQGLHMEKCRTKATQPAAGEAARTSTRAYAYQFLRASDEGIHLKPIHRDAEIIVADHVFADHLSKGHVDPAGIVRACNSHAALVAALEKLANVVDTGVLDCMSAKEIRHSYSELNKASDEARAALKAATE